MKNSLLKKLFGETKRKKNDLEKNEKEQTKASFAASDLNDDLLAYLEEELPDLDYAVSDRGVAVFIRELNLLLAVLEPETPTKITAIFGETCPPNAAAKLAQVLLQKYSLAIRADLAFVASITPANADKDLLH